MEQIENIEELRKAADYITTRNRLRRSGAASIIFGVIITGIGLYGSWYSNINLIPFSIGVLSIVGGIWVLLWPSPAGMIANYTPRIWLGIWILIITVVKSLALPGHSCFDILVGVLFIGWGGKGLQRFKRVSAILKQPRPSEDSLKQLKGIAQDIINAADANDIISFVKKSFTGRLRWKVRLSGDTAVFVARNGKEIIIAKKGEVNDEQVN